MVPLDELRERRSTAKLEEKENSKTNENHWVIVDYDLANPELSEILIEENWVYIIMDACAMCECFNGQSTHHENVQT